MVQALTVPVSPTVAPTDDEGWDCLPELHTWAVLCFCNSPSHSSCIAAFVSCPVSQLSPPPAPSRAPLTNIPICLPWEMVAVDILQLTLFCQNDKYLLVIEDYFTKWAEAIPLPDQTANRITRELIHVFTRFGLPTILHSDQGANFESMILRQTLDAFGVRKSRTTAYHPQGDRMVERFNRTLLQMLRSYTSQRSDWEQHLPLVLFAYCSATHPSTGFSPFQTHV